MAADLVLGRGVALSARDLARLVGADVDDVLALWRTLGFAAADPGVVEFSVTDVEITQELLGATTLEGLGVGELLRVIGGSLASVADAAVALYVQTSETDLVARGAAPVDFARDSAGIAVLALRLADSLGPIFTHHLRDAVRRQRLAQSGVSEKAVARVAVGFVDLVGFTPLTAGMAPRALLEVVTRFEARAFDLAAAEGGRVVKHIGDEIMFVSLDAASACRIASSLMAGFGDSSVAARGGLSFGEVVTRHGDYYGPVVNLASRLVDEAVPGEVLVDEAVVAAAGPSVSVEPAGRRQLKGFEAPVRVFSLGDLNEPGRAP